MNYRALDYSGVNNFSYYGLSKNVFFFIGLACFSCSLFLPTFFTSAEDIYGYWVLITGWVGLVFLQLAWFSNPLNLLAILISEEKPLIAVLLSLLSLLLATATFDFYEIPIGINQEKVFVREFGLGLYLWITAHICIFIALFIHFLCSLKKHCS